MNDLFTQHVQQRRLLVIMICVLAQLSLLIIAASPFSRTSENIRKRYGYAIKDSKGETQCSFGMTDFPPPPQARLSLMGKKEHDWPELALDGSTLRVHTPSVACRFNLAKVCEFYVKHDDADVRIDVLPSPKVNMVLSRGPVEISNTVFEGQFSDVSIALGAPNVRSRIRFNGFGIEPFWNIPGPPR